MDMLIRICQAAQRGNRRDEKCANAKPQPDLIGGPP